MFCWGIWWNGRWGDLRMRNLYACPCCGEKTIKELDDYEICPVCDWEDDPGQSEYPDDDLGANTMSLNDFREAWVQRNIPPIAV